MRFGRIVVSWWRRRAGDAKAGAAQSPSTCHRTGNITTPPRRPFSTICPFGLTCLSPVTRLVLIRFR